MLSGLYYPFSRCIDINSLKQMLMVFEQVCFFDVVDDEAWRLKLLEDLSKEQDAKFIEYKNVYKELDALIGQNIVRVISPRGNEDVVQSPEVSASAVSDLMDDEWCATASKPERFGMPFFPLGKGSQTPSWQIFLPKLPNDFLSTIQQNESLENHLIHRGHEHTSWSLTYEAGSAITTNVHLAVAEKYNLAPITDSRMHHTLLLMKLNRRVKGGNEKRQFMPENVVKQLAQQTAISVIDNLIPRNIIKEAPLGKILEFRENSKDVRKYFIDEISVKIRTLKDVNAYDELHQVKDHISSEIMKELRIYQSELESIKSKTWPKLLDSFTKSLVPGSASAVGFSYIGSPGLAIASSIMAASISLLQSSLTIKSDIKKHITSTAPSIAYLSQVQETFK